MKVISTGNDYMIYDDILFLYINRIMWKTENGLKPF